ncbi:ATP-binding protein [Roseomonas sp. CECT 9278]|uniref:ATP-binding protein n=1 Tax=Roseomonas sp. CECT 9278 TaxID=2845823 RepID=UPI001E3BD022|nr:ATP-binding protein [Roseomonas sp. CECT 9278]CAH0139026.1 Adaptive-response sensory-kinase SasA [Roseomonas sp. CECT 9278]
MAAPSVPRRFVFARWFMSLSLACVVASAVGTAVVLSRFLTEHMLQRDAEVSADFIESIVRAERTWGWFADPGRDDARRPLDSFFNHVAQMPGVVRANVYQRDGTVLWSSDAAMIGRRFAGNPELDQAFAGRVLVEYGDVDSDKPEHMALDAATGGSRFMEAYLPVWDAERREVIGVVEIYRLPQALFRAVDQGVRLVWMSSAAGALLLYLALAWLVRRAGRAIREQQDRLVEAEALAAIGAVASAVAHGIRNPLASIRSSAELAAEEASPEASREGFADIVREVDRLEGWVRDLLLQARGEQVVPQAVALLPLLQASLRSLAPLAERRGVRFDIAAHDVPPVSGTPGALAQAIENILGNAVEAMHDGGAVSVGLGPAEDARMVEIRIADTGPGLPPGLPREGPPTFFSTKARGTGLGLALARRIIGGHGGSLALASTPRGTVATIRLPAVAAR